MKKIDIENFIRQNKAAFDEDFEQKDIIWQAIQDHTVRKRKLSYYSLYILYGLVASVILLIGFASFWLGRASMQEEGNWHEVEQHYQRMLDQKVGHLQTELVKNYYESYEVDKIMGAVDELDSAYHSLKKEGNLNKHRHLLIQNLQLRIQLLNEQILLLQELNHNQDETLTSI